MNMLFLCCTYYQLIVSIQIKRTMYPEDRAVLLLTNDSMDSRNVAERLGQEDLFTEVYYVDKKQYLYLTGLSGMIHCMEYSFSGIPELSTLKKQHFDSFFYFNDDEFAFWIFVTITGGRHKVRQCRYEEGYVSYYVEPRHADIRKSIQISTALRKVLGQQLFWDDCEEFYCFNPEFYKGTLTPVSIPRIVSGDQDLISLLERIFDFSDRDCEYPQRCIYFASCFDLMDGGVPDGEISIVKKAEAFLNGEKVMIKVHPRDSIDRFEAENLIVDKNSRIPFEAIQLCHNFSESVFLTALSGSVLTVSTIMENPPRILFLNKLYPAPDMPYLQKWGPVYDILVEDILRVRSDMHIRILGTEEELKDELRANG